MKGWLPSDLNILIQSLVILLINPFFIIFFWRYHKNYVITGNADFDKLVAKYKITNREKEIIQCICAGKTNKEIAEELFISPLTVRDHISNILQKTNIKNRLLLSNLLHK